MTAQEKIAVTKYERGEKPSVSTFIDEDTIISGYGKLDYDFEYPLPMEMIAQIYGTTSWEQWFKNKGLFHWKTINKETGAESLLGVRMTEEEMEKTKLIEGNENFEFIKI